MPGPNLGAEGGGSHIVSKGGQTPMVYCEMRTFSSRLNWVRTFPSDSTVEACWYDGSLSITTTERDGSPLIR